MDTPETPDRCRFCLPPPDEPHRNQVGHASRIETVMKKRCWNCGTFWIVGEKEICRYHPGSYLIPGHLSGLLSQSRKRWTCCSSFDEKAPGCVTANRHVEDTEATAALSKIKAQSAYTEQTPGAEKPEKTEPQFEEPKLVPIPGKSAQEVEAEIREKEEEKKRLAEIYRERIELQRTSTLPAGAAGKHKVQHDHDTVVGIALQYKTTANEVRRLNGLGTDAELYTRDWIAVPIPTPDGPPDEEKEKKQMTEEQEAALMRKRLIGALRGRFSGHCTEEEATTYLSIAGWDLEKATASLRKDKEWEEAAGAKYDAQQRRKMKTDLF